MIIQSPIFAADIGKPALPPSAPKPGAASYHYTATLSGTARRQGKIQAGGILWDCIGARCTVSGPWPTPGVGACRALAQQVGPVRAYGHPARHLTAAELSQCNLGVTATMPKPPVPVPPAWPATPPSTAWKPVPGLPPANTTPPTYNTRGDSAGEVRFGDGIAGRRPPSAAKPRPFTPWTVTTTEISLLGVQHTPRLVTTNAIVLDGRQFTAMTINTDRLSLEGLQFTPRVVETRTISLTGLQFSPHTISTPAIALEGRSFTPQTINTQTIELMGGDLSLKQPGTGK